MSAATGPAPRRIRSAAFDTRRGRFIVFGGYNGTTLGDTWEYYCASCGLDGGGDAGVDAGMDGGGETGADGGADAGNAGDAGPELPRDVQVGCGCSSDAPSCRGLRHCCSRCSCVGSESDPTFGAK